MRAIARPLASAGLAACLSVACAQSASLTADATPEQMYEAAVIDMEDGLYPEALKTFESLRARYPYAPAAALAELRIGDVHLRSGRHLEAIEAYRTFGQLRPRHPEAAYAAFKIGEAHLKRAPSDWWFMPPAYEKDLGAVRQGAAALREFLIKHPGSGLAEDARALLLEARRRLGDHELYAARFYLGRQAWRAAARRADGVLSDYQGTGLEPAAFLIAAQAYRELGDPSAARLRLDGLEQAFPDSPEAADGRALRAFLPPGATPLDGASLSGPRPAQGA